MTRFWNSKGDIRDKDTDRDEDKIIMQDSMIVCECVRGVPRWLLCCIVLCYPLA